MNIEISFWREEIVYKFPAKNTFGTERNTTKKVKYKWSSILDSTLKKINFISVDGIKKCHILTKNNKETGREEFSLQFEGINFFEVFKYDDFVNINKITTNDIGTVLRIYGVIINLKSDWSC